MPINMHQIQCVVDNPNLSNLALAKFVGLNTETVRAIKSEYDLISKWKHGGKGVPFLTAGVSGGGINYKIRCKHKTVVSCSSLDSAMDNLDRLIHCLENNNGKLPRTLSEVVFGDLEFIHAK